MKFSNCKCVRNKIKGMNASLRSSRPLKNDPNFFQKALKGNGKVLLNTEIFQQ